MSRRVVASICLFDDEALRRDVLAFMDEWEIPQRQMALSIGMSPGTVHRWFAGKGRVSADFAASLASFCNLWLNNYIIDRTTNHDVDPPEAHP